MSAKLNRFEKQIKLFFENPKISKSAQFYGSIQSATNDKYSDIDIEMAPVSPKKFYFNFLKYLKKIGDYCVVFPVVVNKNPQVFTIVWKNHPLYKKLDIRINSKASTRLIKESCPFDEKLRQFYNLFIGAIRYVKYRKGNDLPLSLKFYRSTHNYLVQVDPKFPLLHKYFFPKNESYMDLFFVEILQKYLKISISNKLIGKMSPHTKFAEKVIKFTQNELFRKRN